MAGRAGLTGGVGLQAEQDRNTLREREGHAMSWCDRLASVPAAGFGMDAHFASADAIYDSLSTILDPLYHGNRSRFSINAPQQPFEVSISTEEGFLYAVDPTKVSINFRHRMKAMPVSGGPPVMEMLSKAAPYTRLLPEVLRRLVDTTLLLPSPKERTVKRVGIVSTTAVAEGDLPPGIKRFIEYVGRPWNGEMEHYTLMINAHIGVGSGWKDRCIHTVTKSEDEEELMTLNFDWQRIYTSGSPLRRDVLIKITEEAERAALRYLEDLAEGRRFDEKLIRETAGV